MLTPFTTTGGSEGIFPCNSIIRQVDKKARGQIKTVFCTRFDLFFQSKHLTRKMANINPGVSFHFSPISLNRLSVANSVKKWYWQLESERFKYGVVNLRFSCAKVFCINKRLDNRFSQKVNRTNTKFYILLFRYRWVFHLKCNVRKWCRMCQYRWFIPMPVFHRIQRRTWWELFW